MYGELILLVNGMFIQNNITIHEPIHSSFKTLVEQIKNKNYSRRHMLLQLWKYLLHFAKFAG